MDKMLIRFSVENYQTLRPLRWMSLMLGCNISMEVKAGERRKFIITPIISLLAVLSVAAQLNFVWQNRHQSILFYTDAICTALQCIISLTKLIHMTVMQSLFLEMLIDVQDSSVLRDLEIFQLELPQKDIMIADMEKILGASWSDIKRQLHFFYVVIFGISSWYFCYCSAFNIYNTYKNPHEFEPIYLFPAQFPKWHKNETRIPHFFIEYIVVGSGWYLCSISGTIFASVFAALSVHGIALLKILCTFISYTTMDEHVPPKERLAYIKCCIKLQQRVYQYCHDLNNIYKIEILPFFILTIFIKCLIIFQASLAGSEHFNLILRGILYFAATTFEVSIFCFNGQRLTTESCQIPLAIYNTKWFNESSQFKFITHMMIMRSHRVLKLTVGGFTSLSLVTLLAIMRTSGSYFLLLREVNDVN